MILASTATEYVRVPFAGKVAGVAVNPTTGSVDLAFVAADLIGEPAGGDWKAGTWETDTTQTPNLYYGRVLVGSGGTVTLAAGLYGVWIRVTLAPETIIRQSGELTVI